MLVDLGTENEAPLYWVIPTLVAAELITSEQIRTKDVEAFQDRWDLIG
ncbi:MAG: hypothetical protein ACLP0J_03415 [Solirubrobacteraceae bacterium]